MTIHVTIDEAEKRLAELVDAALRGEEVLLAAPLKAAVRLVPQPVQEDAEARYQRRLAAFGKYRDRFTDPDLDVGKLMTPKEQEESWDRKFGPAS